MRQSYPPKPSLRDPEQKAKRDAKIIRLAQQGVESPDIAVRFRLSRSFVTQILTEHKRDQRK